MASNAARVNAEKQTADEQHRLVAPMQIAALGRSLIVVAWAAAQMHDFLAAETAAEESVELFRRAGDSYLLATALVTLAYALGRSGRHDEAQAALAKALAIHRQIRDAEGLATGLEVAALVSEDPRRALTLAAAAQATRENAEVQRFPGFAAGVEATLARLRDVLEGDVALETWQSGLRLSTDAAISLAVGPGSDSRASPGAGGRRYVDVDGHTLTRRELDVALLIARGLSNHAIASQLFLSERTVEGHVDRLRERLRVRSRSEIAAWIASRRLLD